MASVDLISQDLQVGFIAEAACNESRKKNLAVFVVEEEDKWEVA